MSLYPENTWVDWREVDGSHLEPHRHLLVGFEKPEDFKDLESLLGHLLLEQYCQTDADQNMAAVTRMHHTIHNKYTADKVVQQPSGLSAIIGYRRRPTNHPRRHIGLADYPIVRFHAIQELPAPHKQSVCRVIDSTIYITDYTHPHLSREIGPVNTYRCLEQSRVAAPPPDA